MHRTQTYGEGRTQAHEHALFGKRTHLSHTRTHTRRPIFWCTSVATSRSVQVQERTRQDPDSDVVTVLDHRVRGLVVMVALTPIVQSNVCMLESTSYVL